MVVIAHLGAIKGLTSFLKGESASFQKMDLNALFRKAHGKNQPSNSASNYTDG